MKAIHHDICTPTTSKTSL